MAAQIVVTQGIMVNGSVQNDACYMAGTHRQINKIQSCISFMGKGLQQGLLAHQLLRDYLSWCMLDATHVDVIWHAG